MKVLGPMLIVLVLLGSLLASCDSGTDNMTAEEYFTEFARIGQEAEDAADSARRPTLSASAPFEERREAVLLFIDDIGRATDDAISSFEELVPPDDVRESTNNTPRL
jgi:hypothetical protein